MKSCGGDLVMSTTEAKEEVKTIRLIVGCLAEAERIDFTPFMAGRISSFSLSVVL